MSDDLPADPEVERLQREGREASDAYRQFLGHAAYQHDIDVAVLSKLATDDKVPERERLRAAAQLLKYRFEAMEKWVEVTAAREQNMERLGIKAPGSPSVALTQVNNRIEIVRATDWRNAPPLEQGEEVVAEVLPEGSPKTNGHATNGKAHEDQPMPGLFEEHGDADDPPA